MKTNVAVFFGGRSVEHEISIISAVQAMGNIDREKYNVIPVYMSKQSVFYSGEALCDVATFRRGTPEKESDPVTFVPKGNKTVMVNLKGGLFKKKDTPIDVCFPIVHGTNCALGYQLTKFSCNLELICVAKRGYAGLMRSLDSTSGSRDLRLDPREVGAIKSPLRVQ